MNNIYNENLILNSSEEITEREFIDISRGILIILVVCGHFLQIIHKIIISSSSNLIFLPVIEAVILYIYSFHMPCFIFISGYLSKNVEKRRNLAFQQLLIPFLLFQIIFYLLGVVLKNNDRYVVYLFTPYFGLWYLWALFIWRYFLPDIIKIKHCIIFLIFFNIAGNSLLGMGKELSMDRVFGFFLFFYIGYIFNWNKIKKMIIGGVKFCLCFQLSCILIYIFIMYKIHLYEIFLQLLIHAKPINFQYNKILFILNFIPLLIGISLGWQFICFCFNFKKLFHYKYVVFIGRDTMPLYISHLVVYIIILKASQLFIHNNMKLYLWMLGIIFSSVLCIICFSNKQYKLMFYKCISCFGRLYFNA